MHGVRGAIFCIAVLSAGCSDVPAGPAPVQRQPAPAEAAVAKRAEPQAESNAEPQPPTTAVQNAKPKPPPGKPEKPMPPARMIGQAEQQAVNKIGQVIKESLELGPTLVIWVIDRTQSARDLVQDVSAAAQELYDSPEILEPASGETKPLATAIVAFDDQTQFVLDPPASDLTQTKAAFDAIQPSTASHEKPFTALKAALDKYLPLRTAERREIVLALVTDEAGEDQAVMDELIEPLRRQAIGLYVIGLPAPWGQQNPFAANPKAAEATDDTVPIVGPESHLSERVDIENWTARRPNRPNMSLVDSGFGPFALERLCRASRGKFLLLRPGLGYGNRAVSALTWPSGNELKFDEKVLSKYTPDYVSAAEYQKLLADNKACAALVAAAALPKVSIEGAPGERFPKDVEAKMAKKLSAAQQFAAKNAPFVDRLFEVLSPGESDRPRLTSPRWQAEFDLAMGRVLANKARLDGYNSMIAALKRGKNFQKPESTAWVLESADNFETESTIRKLADKAKMYLERVIQEHPGTPWAEIAEDELKTPLGWTWKEA